MRCATISTRAGEEPEAMAAEPLLEVEDLRVEFATDEGLLRAVNGLSFAVGRGETLVDRRRIRQRQVGDRPVADGPRRRAARPHRRRPS
jgi:hypothetical protein